MSNNKRIRSSKQEQRLNDLIKTTLLHDTYTPLILKWLDPLYLIKNIPLVSKWFNQLLFYKGYISRSLCKNLIKSDFGCFIERCPVVTIKLKNTKPRDLMKDMYTNLDHIFENDSDPTHTISKGLVKSLG
ncbi:MAG: hypothetical protein GY714_14150 [Desulfobacterales bacterium]|nr:hypothetical protein [Desulfobacterales bacterium]